MEASPSRPVEIDSDTDSDMCQYECDPGLCVIMNNIVFNTSQLHELKGGKRDEEVLKHLFKKLGFSVMVHRNLTAEKMKSTAEGYGRMKHHGVFFFIILSHGGEGVVYGTDGNEVEVDQLKELFYATNCPSLAGIPKIFMIDACRGIKNEGAHHFMKKYATWGANQWVSITDSKDFFTIFASTRGTTAGIDPERGSYFIIKFVDVITKADPDKDIDQIMKKVQRRMKIQTSEPRSTLNKDYYIKRYQVKHEALKESQQCQVLQERFAATFNDWLPVRENLIIEVKDTATNLEKYNHNARNTGPITSTLASAITCIFWFILLSSMLNTPLIIVGVGTVLSLLQHVGVFNIIRASNVGNREKLKVQKQLDADDLQFEVIQQMAEDIQLPIKKICTNIQVAALIVNVNMIIAKLATSTPLAATIQVGVVVSIGAVGICFIGAALGLSIVLILFNLAEIIQSGYSLANVEVIKQLNKLVVELQEEKENTRKEANKM